MAVVAALAVGGVFVAMSLNKGDGGGKGNQAESSDAGGGAGGSDGGRQHNGDGPGTDNSGGPAKGNGNGQGQGRQNANGEGPGASSDAGPNGAETVKQGDQTKTISKDKCTNAYDYFNDKKKKTAPDLKFVYITSAKDCLTAAGWRYRVEYTDENTWGKGTVMNQTPANGDPFDPHSPSEQFVLTVSTGKRASGG